ncbi:hypothetical protein MUK42_18521 [Musa troglodytarum]|uniref:Uncharacterized protein n=1 Tax=Musa troglodytarum TaxID=320322 RepID=A0A9E7K2L5_9LILI|nr:hypothetical protein MUK42_18521 [Musa troglodytarum]
MGACATKARAELEQPAAPPDHQVKDGKGGQEVERGPAQPEEHRRRSLSDLFLGTFQVIFRMELPSLQNEETSSSSETAKNILSETVTAEPVLPKEEVIECKASKEAVVPETDEQPTQISKAVAAQAITTAAPQETCVPSTAADSVASVANAVALGSDTKAQVETAKVEATDSSVTEGSPDAQEKAADA